MIGPRTIQVQMEVEDITPIGEDTVRVGGYVGDSRVIVYLPKTDLQLRPEKDTRP